MSSADPRSMKSRLNRFEKREEPAPAPVDKPNRKKFVFQTPKQEKCLVCNIGVYPTEKLVADEKVYHKLCFKCKKCNKTMSVGKYASLDGQIFCKPHFIELFKQKGNYEEGFGKQRHKNKWINKQGSSDSPSEGSKHSSKETTPDPQAEGKQSSPDPQPGSKHSSKQTSPEPQAQNSRKDSISDKDRKSSSPETSRKSPA